MLAHVALEVDLWDCILQVPMLKNEQGRPHSAFATQGRHHKKSKTGVPVTPRKDMCMCLPKTLKTTQKTRLTTFSILGQCWSPKGYIPQDPKYMLTYNSYFKGFSLPSHSCIVLQFDYRKTCEMSCKGGFTQIIPEYENHIILRYDDITLYPPPVYSRYLSLLINNFTLISPSKDRTFYDSAVVRYVHGPKPDVEETLLADF